MRHFITSAVTMLGALALGISANATTLPFGYESETNPVQWYGNGKAETYDVAMKVTDPSLIGMKVTGLKVAVPEGITAETASGWLTSELKLTADASGAKVPVIDIAQASATVSGTTLSVTFAEPYLITEQPFYAGYTFTVPSPLTDATKEPVAVCKASVTDGLFMHSTRTQRNWVNKGNNLKAASAMTLFIEGEFPDYNVKPISAEECRATPTEGGSVTVTVTNMGRKDATSLGYTLTYAGKTYSGDCPLATPLAAKLGSYTTLTLAIPAGIEAGSGELTIAITKVNGNANSSDATVSSMLSVLGFIPINRPLTEEYTGLWCGWCPRGFVAMELMSEAHKDFVGVAYHSGDQMQCVEQFPNTPSGYPSAVVNRMYQVDPYYGAGSVPFGINAFWQELCKQFTPASIEATAAWTDTNEEVIEATATMRFASHPSSTYRVDFILVSDGLTNPNWLQTNNYAGEKAPDNSPLWQPFCKGSSQVAGLVFNDVVICYKGGNDGVTIAPETSNVDVTATITIPLSEAVSVYGESLVQNKGNLRVVAALVDTKTGAVLNSFSTPHLNTSGIDAIGADAEQAVATEWYDLTGKRVAAPSNGLYIRSARMADGRVITDKVIR